MTELDLHFGIVTNRVKNNTNSSSTIKPLNGNKQCETGTYDYKENKVRTLFRKWDSVKIISDEVKVKSKPRMKYAKGSWGVKVVSKIGCHQQIESCYHCNSCNIKRNERC